MVLRVVTNSQLDAKEQEEADRKAAIDTDDADTSALIGMVRQKFHHMRNHRDSSHGWNDRLIKAQRVFNGEYDPAQLAQIREFSGSEVYARVVAVKCRGASALLRDVYLSGEKSWGLEPTPEPDLPESIMESVLQLVQVEVETLRASGQMPEPQMVRDRLGALRDAAQRAAKKTARAEARKAEARLDDLLVQGKFYTALAEFIVDLPYFPFACIKGPVVRIVPTVQWVKGRAVRKNTARMFWQRVSPFDLYWTPGVSDIRDADVIERVTYTRADLNAILDLPGYRSDAIREVLRDHGAGGLYDFWEPTDSERAENESRENPQLNQSGLIYGVEFHGNVQGKMLRDYDIEIDEKDEHRDFHVQLWAIGRHVIKLQLTPNPRQDHPYFITSFEKVPGTPVGNALPDILADIQDVCNATLRALVNNLSISSGPQVVVNDDRLAPGEDGENLYPWKRWHISADPMGNRSTSEKPVDFFQPSSNAMELLNVYEKFTQIADELSAIPRYITGSERMGGAGRTASGLAMLMGNASKILQTVAANIDRDVIQPLLEQLYEMVMLTDETGILRGDEEIRVRGVDVAIQRETDRQRQIELLGITSNPIDMQIIGPKGRAKLLRSVSSQVGLDGEDIIPPEEELETILQQAAMQPGSPEGAKGAPPPARNDPPGLGQREASAVRGIV